MYVQSSRPGVNLAEHQSSRPLARWRSRAAESKRRPSVEATVPAFKEFAG